MQRFRITKGKSWVFYHQTVLQAVALVVAVLAVILVVQGVFQCNHHLERVLSRGHYLLAQHKAL
jgi:hypothetical protein